MSWLGRLPTYCGLLSLLVLAGGCASGGSSTVITSAAEAHPQGDDERHLWARGDQLDALLERSGQLYLDPALTAYLDSVLVRLYPELRGSLRVRVLRAPVLNAFAVPNGSIYVNLGMLASLENEAQLATVLAHEVVHVLHRHGLRKQQGSDAALVFAALLQVSGGASGAFGALITVSSISGYSRELERDADSSGFQRLVMAGYAPDQAVRTFELLAREAQAMGEDQPFFFASHPRLLERIESFSALVADAKTPTGRIEALRYAEQMRHVRSIALAEQIEAGRYSAIIASLGGGVPDTYPPDALFYLGEAYRLRGDDGDLAYAEQAYARAVDRGVIRGYRGLGLVHLKRGAPAAAVPHLQRYLALRPDAADRSYIERYIERAIAASGRGENNEDN